MCGELTKNKLINVDMGKIFVIVVSCVSALLNSIQDFLIPRLLREQMFIAAVM